MPSEDINWDAALQDAAGSGFTPVPNGPYDVRVEEAEAVTFQSGSPGIKVKWTIIGGPHDGRLLFDNLVFKEGQARNISVRNLTTIGIDRAWLQAESPSLAQVAMKLVGLSATATVSQREYQGEMRNEIKKYAAASGTPAPAPAAAAPAPAADAPVAPDAAPAAPAAEQPPKPF